MEQRIGNRTAKINSIMVVDRRSQRLVQLNRNVVFLRSDDGIAVNVLNSYDPRERAAWCVQVIAQPNHCLLVNIGSMGIQLPGITTARVLSPQSTERVIFGELVQLDGFSFTFHRQRISDFVELAFSLPLDLTHQHTEDNPLEGIITLYNKGDEPKVQFYITEIEGLNSENYRINSRQPKLIHTRERSVTFSVFHTPDHAIEAGYYYIGIYAKTDCYLGEVADFQEVYVHPFYTHELDFEHDKSERK